MRAGAGAAALAALLVLGAAGCGGETTGADVEVVAVLDGDTIEVRVGGAADTVRIIGINAPERGECLAEQATAALSSLLAAGPVALIVDTSERDRHDRLLRYVEAGGVDVGLALVADGLAVTQSVEPDTARRAELEAAQAAARAAARGLWARDACGDPVPGATGLRIAELRLDAEGPDDRNLNDEWVVIANDGPGAVDVDLGGWVLRDESTSHRYTFPPGTTLAAGASVRVRSGCGTDSATDLHWCESGSAIWNNDGDTAFLLDPSGNVVATRTEAGR